MIDDDFIQSGSLRMDLPAWYSADAAPPITESDRQFLQRIRDSAADNPDGRFSVPAKLFVQAEGEANLQGALAGFSLGCGLVLFWALVGYLICRLRG